MPHVDAIGSHPSEFFTHLKAANYTYTIYKTYSEVHYLYRGLRLLSLSPILRFPVPPKSRGTSCGLGCMWPRRCTRVYRGYPERLEIERHPSSFLTVRRSSTTPQERDQNKHRAPQNRARRWRPFDCIQVDSFPCLALYLRLITVAQAPWH